MTKYSAGFGKFNGMRDLTATLYPGSGILHNFGTGCGNGKADDIRDSDDRGSGCGIPALVLDPISFVGYSKEVLL